MNKKALFFNIARRITVDTSLLVLDILIAVFIMVYINILLLILDSRTQIITRTIEVIYYIILQLTQVSKKYGVIVFVLVSTIIFTIDRLIRFYYYVNSVVEEEVVKEIGKDHVSFV
jgi:hypothetical protein